MKAIIKKSRACGSVAAPPSKSVLHRMLICAALSKEESLIGNAYYSEDISATLDCLSAMGAKVEKGETFPQALVRECQEELAITLNVGEQFMQVVHQYPDILIRLTLFHCTIAQGVPERLEH